MMTPLYSHTKSLAQEPIALLSSFVSKPVKRLPGREWLILFFSTQGNKITGISIIMGKLI